jgi:hypothetical protein
MISQDVMSSAFQKHLLPLPSEYKSQPSRDKQYGTGKREVGLRANEYELVALIRADLQW